MANIDEEMIESTENFYFVNDKGSVCDYVVFRDINNKPLGLTIVNEHDFTIPDGTCYCDYTHQSEYQGVYTTRIVLGTIVEQNKDKIIVNVTMQGQNKMFDAKAGVDYVKVANSKDDFLVMVVNETFTKMQVPDQEESKSRSIA